MTKENLVSGEFSSAVSTSALELASRLEAAERIPVNSLSFAEIVSLNDLAIQCGGNLLRLRASAFAEQRHHEAKQLQAALRHDKEISATKQMCAEQREIAVSEFQMAKDAITRQANEAYDDLCKEFEKRKGDFERLRLPLRTPPTLHEAQSSEDAWISFHQALSDWEPYRAIPAPNAALYFLPYLAFVTILSLMLGSVGGSIVLGLVFPGGMYGLFILSQLKLQRIEPALVGDGVRIRDRMEAPILSAQKRLNARFADLDVRLRKELEEVEGRHSRALYSLKNDQNSIMCRLKETVHSLDEESLRLFHRLTTVEAAWYTENYQAVAPCSAKPNDWTIPAPRLLRLGSLSLTSQNLIELSSRGIPSRNRTAQEA